MNPVKFTYLWSVFHLKRLYHWKNGHYIKYPDDVKKISEKKGSIVLKNKTLFFNDRVCMHWEAYGDWEIKENVKIIGLDNRISGPYSIDKISIGECGNFSIINAFMMDVREIRIDALKAYADMENCVFEAREGKK